MLMLRANNSDLICAWHLVPPLKHMESTTKSKRPRDPRTPNVSAQGSGRNGRGGRGAKNLWLKTQATVNGNEQERTRNKALTVAAWNVRTLTDRKNSGRAERRTALVTRELKRYGIDIAALSETRKLDKGQLVEAKAGYTVFWSGRSKGRKSGVGFTIRTDLVSQLESPRHQ